MAQNKNGQQRMPSVIPRRSEVFSRFLQLVAASTLCYVNSETIRSINPARKLCTHYEQFEYETGCKFRPEITVYIYSMNL